MEHYQSQSRPILLLYVDQVLANYDSSSNYRAYLNIFLYSAIFWENVWITLYNYTISNPIAHSVWTINIITNLFILWKKKLLLRILLVELTNSFELLILLYFLLNFLNFLTIQLEKNFSAATCVNINCRDAN